MKATCLPANNFLILLLEWNYFTVNYELGELVNGSILLNFFKATIKFQCNKSSVWKRSDNESGKNRVTYPPNNVTVDSVGKVEWLKAVFCIYW